jgi:hypothetical protein
MARGVAEPTDFPQAFPNSRASRSGNGIIAPAWMFGGKPALRPRAKDFRFGKPLISDLLIRSHEFRGFCSLSFEADYNAVGAQRQLQPLALRVQAHGDALIVVQPKGSFSLIAQRPP